MNVTVKDSYAPYLVSTSEVQFSKGDTVSAKAAELCRNAKTDEAKVIAIYNYMASRYTYDNKLANEITSGKITKYIPDTAATLKAPPVSATISPRCLQQCAAARASRVH